MIFHWLLFCKRICVHFYQFSFIFLLYAQIDGFSVRKWFFDDSINEMRLIVNRTLSQISQQKQNEIRKVVEKLAKKSGIEVPEVYITRLELYNACVTGDATRSLLCIGEGLINKLTLGELKAVLGHEFGHLKKDHTFSFWRLTTTIFTIQLILVGIVAYKATKNIPIEDRLDAAKLVFYLVGFVSGIPVGLLCSYVSRRQEYEADEFSVKLLKNRKLALALGKITPREKDKEETFPWKFFSTHPSMSDRQLHIDTVKIS